MDDHNGFLDRNLKGLMMDIVGRWNAQMDERQAKSEFAGIRPSDQRLFGQLRGRPTLMIELHQRLGITKQAAHNSIMRLVDHGVVAVVEAPGNRKSKIITVTKKGEQLRKLAARSIAQIEAECAQKLGQEGVEQLRNLLEQLVVKETTKALVEAELG